jgi:PAS domain S-box-containing protein
MPPGIALPLSTRRNRRANVAGAAARPAAPAPAAGADPADLLALVGPELRVPSGLGVVALAADLEGVIRHCAGDAAAILGRTPEQLLGSDFTTTVLAHVDPAVLAGAAEALHSCGRWRGTLPLSRTRVRVRARVIRDRAGTHVGYAALLIDAAEQLDAPAAPAGNETAALWQATLDALPAHAAMLDERGRIVAVSASWRRFAEQEDGGRDHVGESYLAVCDAAEEPAAAEMGRLLRDTLAGRREHFELEYTCHGPDERRWCKAQATRLRDVGATHVVVVHEDVTAARRAEEQAATQAAMLRKLDAAIIVTDLDFRVQSWNSGAERLYGYSAEEAVGQLVGELRIPVGGSPLDRAALLRDHKFDTRTTARRKDGSHVSVQLHYGLVCDQHGAPEAIVGVSSATSDASQLAREAVTARNYLRAVSHSMAEAMCTVDRDGYVTDMNPVATELLGWTREDLRRRPLAEILHDPEACADGCELERIGGSGETIRVTDEVFRCKDGSQLAVAYTAAPIVTGEGSDGCVIVFEDITEHKARDEQLQRELDTLAWVSRVQDALADERFVLHAQPIVDVTSGEVTQWELLLRMLAPDGDDGDSLIAPGTFLPAAEEHGLIRDIDRWVVERAAELAAGGAAVELNLSGASVSDPALPAHVEAAIARTGADPRRLIFEITETTVVTDEQAATRFVEQMHALGCRIGLDDFGTGYGTFTYLKQLPIDYLKVDVEFVRDLAENPASRKVVEAIVSLADSFGLKTIGEGVEDEHTVELLRRLGVDYVQGFHLGRPEPLGARMARR